MEEVLYVLNTHTFQIRQSSCKCHTRVDSTIFNHSLTLFKAVISLGFGLTPNYLKNVFMNTSHLHHFLNEPEHHKLT